MFCADNKHGTNWVIVDVIERRSHTSYYTLNMTMKSLFFSNIWPKEYFTAMHYQRTYLYWDVRRNKINTFQILVMLENETRSNNKNIKNVDPVIGRFCGGIFIFFAIKCYYYSYMHACLLCLPTWRYEKIMTELIYSSLDYKPH